MDFESFEQALHICMTATPGSDEHEGALIYCLENAPPELKDKITEALAKFHKEPQQGCGCGCNHDHD
ncbi:MAG: hypothetical protein FP813_02065 [Desulfurivibrio sp.]|nr:hypothetical protein [Desulfurivibrio sp.]MBU3936108.1 hypothetical protein [Pseudomonadota bacterium]MBU4118197.1 hypothetical protein [Pseudomonadota bacterium]